jgi:signal peptidase I
MKRKTAQLIRFFCALYTGFVALLMVLLLPGYFGIQIEVVASGSMEPAIPTGSVIYVKAVDWETIKPGDVVTYRMAAGNVKVTHRVEEKEEADRQLRTKGDANQQKDSWVVPFQDVEGKVVFVIPAFGRLLLLFGSLYGKAMLLVILLLLCILNGWMRQGKSDGT